MGCKNYLAMSLFAIYILSRPACCHVVDRTFNWLSILNYAYNKPDPFLVGGAGHETKYGHAASYCMR